MIKRLLIIMVLLFFSGLAVCPPKKDNTIEINEGVIIKPFEKLWRATCMVESSNNPLAYNPKEKAFGIVQIRMIRLKDYNKRTGKHYKPQDCYSPKISKEIWLYYAERIGESDLERIARSWNGTGKKTKIYWDKVKKHL